MNTKRSSKQKQRKAKQLSAGRKNGTRGRQQIDGEPKRQLQAALSDLKHGRYSVPIPFKEKGPTEPGWDELRLNKEQLEIAFAAESNRGLLLGEPSGNLVERGS